MGRLYIITILSILKLLGGNKFEKFWTKINFKLRNIKLHTKLTDARKFLRQK